MKKQINILILLMFEMITYSYSQNYADIWIYGQGIGLNFESGSPELITNSDMMAIEGCSSICDSTGELLFYTNGGTITDLIETNGAVWNRNHEVMPNGLLIDTAGCWSASSGTIIVPDPSSQNKYYIFTVDCVENYINDHTQNRGLRYTRVDMNLDGGLGDITEKGIQAMTFPAASYVTTAFEQVTAIPHSNGSGYWIIAYKLDSVNTLLLDTSGVHSPTFQVIGYDELCPSPNNDKILIGEYLYDFNNHNGNISNPIYLGCINGVFSPNGKRLYTYKDGLGLYQYNLESVDIFSSEVFISEQVYGRLKLAPNGKIYFIGGITPYLIGAINCPNEIGNNCNYTNDTILYLQTYEGLGNPNFIQSFFYSESDSCSILANSLPISPSNSIYVNFNSEIVIDTKDIPNGIKRTIIVTNVLGQIIYKELIKENYLKLVLPKTNSINMYIISVIIDDQYVINKKIIID